MIFSSGLCRGSITSVEVMSSPSYPRKYPNNVNCEWSIKFPKDHKIVLNFIEFDLEHHANCTYDWLEVRDGPKSDSPLIGRKLCGKTAPKQITSQGNHLFVKFRSDSSQVRAGFRIQVDEPGILSKSRKLNINESLLTIYLAGVSSPEE